jgi:hypothetical protein
MKQSLAVLLLCGSVAGCAGVDITPISSRDETDAHAGTRPRSGYIVYEPMVVVEVSEKEVCRARDEKGACREVVAVCAAGTPFLLPDMSKPFLVDVRSGFGKTGVEVTITNGWQLGSIKDNSDNTALLGAIEKVASLALARTTAPDAAGRGCKAPGLYRVNATADRIDLAPLLSY